MCLRACLLIVLTLPALSASDAHTGGTTPALQYDRPSGFSRAPGTDRRGLRTAWTGSFTCIPFRPFHGDLAGEFRRTLFRDWISAPYQEDKRLDQPTLTSLKVKGAQAALAASFKNFNGGASREHLRVAVLASGRVALVDISANSPHAFEPNRASFSRLLSSLHVVESERPRRGSRHLDARQCESLRDVDVPPRPALEWSWIKIASFVMSCHEPSAS
jgi:hypothetical protein